MNVPNPNRKGLVILVPFAKKIPDVNNQLRIPDEQPCAGYFRAITCSLR